MTDINRESLHSLLQHGALDILGRIRSASNATFLGEIRSDVLGEVCSVHCVYKPIAGEQPLWDFPEGTLAGRECASYLISAALQWNIVPYTIIRDGPAGPGMFQLWVDQPDSSPDSCGETSSDIPELVDLCPVDSVPAGYLPVLRAVDYAGNEVMLVHADDSQLQRVAVFDVIINNADRKAGHILVGTDGRVYGVDHGVTLHTEDKLRTVLWGWAGTPLHEHTVQAVTDLGEQLNGPLAQQLCRYITETEVHALRQRIHKLVNEPLMPNPNRRQAIPWPAF